MKTATATSLVDACFCQIEQLSNIEVPVSQFLSKGLKVLGRAITYKNQFRPNQSPESQEHEVILIPTYCRILKTITASNQGLLFIFPYSVVGRTPGGFNRLDIPTSKAYILGAPSSQNLLPNFIGCIRDFEIDGHEPMTNAWAMKPDYAIMGRSSIRLCSASDEQ